MRMSDLKWSGLLLIALLTVPTSGGEPAEKAWLLHLNGIGNQRACDQMLLRGLKASGLNADMRIHDWTEGESALTSLHGMDANKKRAAGIADMITRQRKAFPDRPIILTSHSGGTAIAAWTLEALPEDVQIDTWILFAPALSREYDLSKALKRVKGQAHVFSSPNDTLFLNAGTKLFGTMDGQKGEAAGLKGFIIPEQADLRQYRKLVPHPHKLAWFLRYGNAGTHMCPLMPRFAREYVGTILKTGAAPDDAQAITPATQPAQPSAAPAPAAPAAPVMP
jgi:pimeloyl-ACP methyl ester carboxylesterase